MKATGDSSTSEKAPPARPFTVLVLGDCGVGKTSLVTRFTTGTRPGSCLPTVEAATTEVDSLGPVMLIVDTSGHPRYRASLARRYFANADAALLVYDATRRATFESLDERLMELQLLAKAGIEVAVVGNKADDRDGGFGGVGRAVSPAEARLWAEQRCLSHYATVSARSSAEAVFARLIRGGLMLEAPRKATTSSSSSSSHVDDVIDGGDVDCCCCLPLTAHGLPSWRKFWPLRRRNSVAPA